MRYRRPLAVLMPFQTTWTRRRFKPVCRHSKSSTPHVLITLMHSLELDALSDMDENELSYLDDIKAEPDFLDEAPQVPSNEVSFRHTYLLFSCTTISLLILGPSYAHHPRQQERPYKDCGQRQFFTPYFVLWEDIYAPSWILSFVRDEPSHTP